MINEFLSSQVSLLAVIHGQNGGKKGGKVIKSVFDALIDSKIHSLFTWTGKSGNGQKKMAFSIYKETIGLIYTVIRLADTNYSKKDCEKNLTYKVLKYAATSKRFVLKGTTY